MSYEELQSFRVAIKKLDEQIAGDPDRARSFLRKSGLITKTGKLKKAYRVLPEENPHDL